MRLTAAALLLACALASCKRSSRPSAPAAPTPAPIGAAATPPPVPVDAQQTSPAVSLFDALVRDVGARGPVAIVVAADGVVAVSLDGSRKRTVVPQAGVEWVLADDRARVLWFEKPAPAGDSSQLWILDLTQVSPNPELVVKGLPANELVAVGYAKQGDASARDVVVPPLSEYDGCTHVVLGPARSSLKFEGGQYDAIFEDQGEAHEKTVSKAKIVAKATPRLRELALRGSERRLLLDSAPASKPARIAAVKADACEDPDVCGTAEQLPGTLLLRVIVRHECGDACHLLWQMYDPKTKAFIDFKTGRRSPKPILDGEPGNMSGAFFSSGGEGFVIDGDVYSVADGRKVFSGKPRGGGWLGGQRHVGL